MKRSIVAIIHLIIILIVFSSPFRLDWKYIFLLALLNLIQVYLLGGCILSQYQFKDKKQGFYRFYTDKVFPTNKISTQRLNIVLDYIIPICLIFIGYIFQNF